MAVQTIGANTAGSGGSTITAPGATNTKGAWTQLVASSNFASDGIIVYPLTFTATGDILFDIGTGASSSEVAVVSNIAASLAHTNITLGRGGIYIPIKIASGTRISARYQATTTSIVLQMVAVLVAKDTVDIHGITSAVTYGADTTDSGGTSVDPGGSANTKGSYSQLTASTSDDIKWLTVHVGNQNNIDRIAANFSHLIDIATGGAGSESVIIANLPGRSLANVTDTFMPWFYGPFPVEIASGTRIAARSQASSTDATDRTIDITVIGYNGTASGGAGGGANFSASFGD